MANDDFPYIKVDIYLVDERNEDDIRIYQQRFHREYLNSLPYDWLQNLIAMLNKLEKKHG